MLVKFGKELPIRSGCGDTWTYLNGLGAEHDLDASFGIVIELSAKPTSKR